MSDSITQRQLEQAWQRLRDEAPTRRLSDLAAAARKRAAHGLSRPAWAAELEDVAAEIEALRRAADEETAGSLEALARDVEVLLDQAAGRGAWPDPETAIVRLRARVAALARDLARAGDPTITPEERDRALAVHEAAERQFLEAVENLSDDQWRYKPGPERWSVREITEHMVIVEEFIHQMIEHALAGEPHPDWRQFDLPEAMVDRVLDRSARGTAPPPMVPSGEWGVAETMRHYRAARAVTRSIVERKDAPLRSRIASGPPGTFNCYHWLILISLHHQRHNQQVLEVLGDPGFPRNAG